MKLRCNFVNYFIQL